MQVCEAEYVQKPGIRNLILALSAEQISFATSFK